MNQIERTQHHREPLGSLESEKISDLFSSGEEEKNTFWRIPSICEMMDLSEENCLEDVSDQGRISMSLLSIFLQDFRKHNWIVFG